MIHVVLIGNVLNGFTAIGPFNSSEKARQRASVENTGLSVPDTATCATVRVIADSVPGGTHLLVTGTISGGIRLEGPVTEKVAAELAERYREEVIEVIRMENLG